MVLTGSRLHTTHHAAVTPSWNGARVLRTAGAPCVGVERVTVSGSLAKVPPMCRAAPPSRRGARVLCLMSLIGQSSRMLLYLVVSDTLAALPRLL